MLSNKYRMYRRKLATENGPLAAGTCVTLPCFPRKTVSCLQVLPAAATAAYLFPPEAEMDGL